MNKYFEPIANLRFCFKLTKSRLTYKTRSELALSWPLLRTADDGFVRYRFGLSASEYLKSGLHLVYVSTISFVKLDTTWTHVQQEKGEIGASISSAQV